MPLLERLLSSCRDVPDRTAVVDGRDRASYAQLDDRSARVAGGVRRAGAGPGSVVAVLGDRSLGRCVAVLGVLRSGAAVLSLDPDQPPARLRRTVRAAGAALVLRDPSLGQPSVPGRHLTFADAASAPPFAGEEGPVAYVVATSGSTGEPKCVALPPATLDGLAAWAEATSVAPDPVATHAAAVGFDVGYQELVATWARRGTLVVVDDDRRRDPFELVELIDAAEVTQVHLPVPSLHALAIAAGALGACLPRLREVVVAGEQLVVNDDVRRLFTTCPARLVNQYGPSETHVATEHRLGGDPAGWPVHPPIGRPIAGVEAGTPDPGGLRELPAGEVAELAVAGPGVGLGYLGDDELSAARFGAVAGTEPPRRWYRTGDLVEWDGSDLWFRGRADDQLKVQGYRVEPGDVEAALVEAGGVARAAVVGRRDAGTTRLVAFVVPDRAGAVDPAGLAERCSERLPPWMVPSRFVVVDDLPVTATGKVARRDLADRAAAL